ncbi:MAG: exodeoxyribonuclease VII large subunit [Alphaproteobacteria bacterium]|nr:MAG: exodeoxyribonuclease VII large subunit [Alphaproteobacteria bacterium]
MLLEQSTDTYMGVSDFSQKIRTTLEGAFTLVRVRGEISGATHHSSGHLYFTLKDAHAALDVVAWRNVVGTFPVKAQDGLDVIITGRVTTFAGRSKYQLSALSLEVSGTGALLKLLEERKNALSQEGIFDRNRKKAIPYLPQTIGVISSPTGAVIRDIIHRIDDRFPRRIILWPTAVQGEKAAGEIINAIKGFNALSYKDPNRPDVLILARGGGSIEDLWSFNDESLVRCVGASTIPIITAIGHETDTTLVDYASDHRAPTPTAAAEMAVPVKFELQHTVAKMGAHLTRTLHQIIGQISQRISHASKQLTWQTQSLLRHQQRLDDRGMRLRHPQHILRAQTEAIHMIWTRLVRGVNARLAHTHLSLEKNAQVLGSYAYERTLSRGFAVIRDHDNNPITTSKNVVRAEHLVIEMHDGRTCVRSKSAAHRPESKPLKKPRKTPKFTPGLFD